MTCKTLVRLQLSRFNDETRDATATRIQKAAVQLAKEEGLDALNFRSLGARPELDITGTAPLYYFGSKVGLLGAVAEQEWKHPPTLRQCNHATEFSDGRGSMNTKSAAICVLDHRQAVMYYSVQKLDLFQTLAS